MEQRKTTTTNKKPDNKGYSIMYKDEYIGYFVINEKNVAPATIAGLEIPAVMAEVFANCELKAFAPKVDKENDSILSMVADLETTNPEAQAS